MTPKRGEIWHIRLSDLDTGRLAQGTEIAARLGQRSRDSYRMCLIVSKDTFNSSSDRLTVVPLLSHVQEKDGRPLPPWEGKEKTLSRWGHVVNPAPHPSGHVYHPKAHQGSKAAGSFPWHQDIIDCARLRTVYWVAPDSRRRREPVAVTDTLRLPLGQLDDVDWNEPHAELSDLALASVDSALQLLLGGGVRLANRPDHPENPGKRQLPLEEGDVFAVEIPGSPRQQCLVVSSSSIDYLREGIIVKKRPPDRMDDPDPERNGWPLGQITVVPLIPRHSDDDELGTARVVVNGSKALALCQEIYTIDWRARKAEERIAMLSSDDMAAVRKALRSYLYLPSCD